MDYLKHWTLCGFILFGQLTLLAQLSVESESYSSSNGVQLESCSDEGGGLNVGYIDTSDWMEYDLEIPMDGEYQVSIRAASLDGGGRLSLADESTTLGALDIPSTGDWQNWTTVTGPEISLRKGTIKLRMTATTGGFNLNWFELRLVDPVDTDKPSKPTIIDSSADVHSLTINWTASTDATSQVMGYKLYDGDELLAITQQASLALHKLSPNREFNINVRAFDLAGNLSDPAVLIISTLAINWPMTWSEEFDGTEVNRDYWNFQTGGGGWGNGEAQYYTDGANASVSDGLLTIEVKQETIGSNDYTSTRMNTSGKFDFKYGRIEVRAALPGTPGSWPAIWTLPTEWVYGDWPNCGEIDIMEHSATYGYGHVFGTIHTGAYNHQDGTQKGGGVTYDDVTNTFHEYALEWYPDHMDWYYDDVLVFIFENEYKTTAEWPFDIKHHLLLNVAVGGGLGGAISHNGPWPQQMKVDYVRYYEMDFGQKSDTEAPSAPTDLKADVSGINIGLTWSRSTDNYYVEKYYIYLDDVLVDSTSSSSILLNGLEPVTAYKVSIMALDFAGNESEKTSINVSTQDVESIAIPGKFEAEDYLYMYGMQEEDCSDDGGGVNMAFIESGDWLEYSIDVSQTGAYILKVRTAANALTGSFELRDEGGKILTTVQTPKTGGWQNWETVASESFQLAAGIQRISIHSLAKDFNLNWFEISTAAILGTPDSHAFDYDIYPNPVKEDLLTICPNTDGEFHIRIFNLQGKQVLSKASNKDAAIEVVNTSSLKPGLYIIRLERAGTFSQFKIRIE